jgi:hypothetical protein
MLVAGRVGGLTNYELFVDYQKQAMKMFGGFMNFLWNPTTKKLTIIRKIPNAGHNYIRLLALSASGQTVGSTITIRTKDAWLVAPGDSITVSNCRIVGYNNNYMVDTVDGLHTTITVKAKSQLERTEVVTQDLRSTQVWSNLSDVPSENVMLQIYNYKPDVMLLNDHMAYPWIQDYAYSFAKRIVGEARSKFGSIAGPQGGTTLNGEALKTEAAAEMEKLEDDLRRYIDGAQPMWWITG